MAEKKLQIKDIPYPFENGSEFYIRLTTGEIDKFVIEKSGIRYFSKNGDWSILDDPKIFKEFIENLAKRPKENEVLRIIYKTPNGDYFILEDKE